MEKLIELRTFIENKKKQALERQSHYKAKNNKQGYHATVGYDSACLDIIEQLDLILNNSVVKPSERRSPTDETFSGCKPPERKAKSTEDKDKCEHLVERAIGQQGELFVCRKCGEHGQHLSIYWA